MFTLNDGGVLEVVLWATNSSAGEMRLVFQWRLLSGGPLNLAEIAVDVEEWLLAIIDEIIGLVNDNITFTGFSVNTLDDNFTSGFLSFGTPVVGTNATDPLPSGVACLVYMNTGVARRQLRKYLFGFAEDQIGAFGNFGSATLTTVLGIAPFLLTNQTMTNGVWEYGHAQAGVGTSWITPAQLTVAAVPAYQRRRRQGRGI